MTSQPIPKEAIGLEGPERRRSPRYECRGVAECYAIERGSLFRGEIQTVSRVGCFIATTAPLRLERENEVDLQFTVMQRSYHAMARVMSIRPGEGVGLEFLPNDPGTEQLLGALVGSLAAASEA